MENRGILEENTMAILDNSGFSNSKNSHHLNDDRRSFLEAVRTAFLLPDNGSRPSGKLFDAIFHILRDADSFDLTIESYELLVELDKRFPQVVTSEGQEPNSSAAPRDSVYSLLTERAWQPFNFESDNFNEKRGAESHSKSSLDSLGFHDLVEEISEMLKNQNPEAVETALLKRMMLLQYLISVLEGDFYPRYSNFRENLNWALLRESTINKLLGSMKTNYKTLMKECITTMSNLSYSTMIPEEASHLELEGLHNDTNRILSFAFPEVKRSTCCYLRKLIIMVMELDLSWKTAYDQGLTNRADRRRTPVVEIILDEVIYGCGILCSFIQAFDATQKLEIISQYFQKYMPKSAVQTRRSSAPINAHNFEGILQCFCNVSSTKCILRKMSSEIVQLLLAHAFQAHLSLLRQPTSNGVSGSSPDAKNKLLEVCRNILSAFTNLRKEDPTNEIGNLGKEALFTAATILSIAG